MANPIIVPKKSTIAARVPANADLASGEICINHADKKLYAKHPSTGAIQAIGGMSVHAIQEIGGMSVHSHDEIYSPDSSQLLELQNNSNLTITAGGTTKTFTLPSASGTIATLSDISGSVSGVSGTLATLSNVNGGSQSYEVRHVYSDPYSYTGTAVDGTSESASGWIITRLQISSSGTTTKTNASGAWSNRTSLSYS